MSAKTKIVVLHMKELIYTGIFAALGILFIVLLVIMFLPDKKNAGGTTGAETTGNDTPVSSTNIYIPGIYTTELVLGGQVVDVEVIVDSTSITSIQMVNLSEAVTTMYPLLQPTFDTICQQVYETQSLEGITYTADSKYTSLVLLEAIKSSLEKATHTEEILPEVLPSAEAFPEAEFLPGAEALPETEVLPNADVLPSADTLLDTETTSVSATATQAS